MATMAQAFSSKVKAKVATSRSFRYSICINTYHCYHCLNMWNKAKSELSRMSAIFWVRPASLPPVVPEGPDQISHIFSALAPPLGLVRPNTVAAKAAEGSKVGECRRYGDA